MYIPVKAASDMTSTNDLFAEKSLMGNMTQNNSNMLNVSINYLCGIGILKNWK